MLKQVWPICYGTSQSFQASQLHSGLPLEGSHALLQVTGEAQYTDDVPLPPNTLHAALVKSIRPHAKINSVDPSAALQVGLLSKPLTSGQA